VPAADAAAIRVARAASRRARATVLAAATLLIMAGAQACSSAPSPYVVISRTAPGGTHVAAIRATRCGPGWCDGLWLGPDAGTATLVATLAPDSERAGEIAWTQDGARVGFLVNGHQLRLYNAATKAPAGQLDLVPPDGTPTTRIARGITFSDNGAAITFDDCPRDRSGCRPGMVAVR